MDKGTTVKLTVAAPSTSITVPNVAGTAHTGGATLSSHTLTAGQRQPTRARARSGRGLVASTTPRAGSTVAKGTTLGISVSHRARARRRCPTSSATLGGEPPVTGAGFANVTGHDH